VVRWKKRFCINGLSGRSDNHRSGRPSKYGDDFRKQVMEKLQCEPPEGYGQWDGALLARELNVSKDAV